MVPPGRGTDSPNLLASIDFGQGLSGIYDFNQAGAARNPMMPRRLLVHGDEGEISGDQVVRLGDNGLITTSYLTRLPTGAEPGVVSQIRLGDHVLWSNPWPTMSWGDTELATAQLLTNVAEWLKGEAAQPYSLSEAIWDARLGLAISQAVHEDRPVEVPENNERMEPWTPIKPIQPIQPPNTGPSQSWTSGSV